MDDFDRGAEYRGLKANFNVGSGNGKLGLQGKPERSLRGRRALTVSKIVIELASPGLARIRQERPRSPSLFIGNRIGNSELDWP
jgi:hypothetical protein